ncbi:DUF6894 family protein, partial [Methylobacterium sp. E-065]|uniref:DUF6894 family protein n=1 Tax=Methylobacterium sp. E-065 TaxID=2836583 RepID=UPI00391912DD
MPCFFIALHDGTEVAHDKDGYELPDLDAARAQALRIMIRIAQGLSDSPGRQDSVAAVRDAEGAVRWRFRMSLDTDRRWRHQPPVGARPASLRCAMTLTLTEPIGPRLVWISLLGQGHAGEAAS